MSGDDTTPPRPRGPRIAGALVGLAVGLALAFALPESWLFREPASGGGMRMAGVQWACPMFCALLDELPENRKCPVCGMELGEVSASAALDDHERWMIGLEAEPLLELPLVREVRLVGEVDYDERRIGLVSARAAGWIEVLSRTVTWEEVEEGEVLFELYSPEVYEAQQELLVAAGLGADVLEAARRKLVLLGLTDQEIDRVREAGAPLRRIPYRSPRSGIVIRRGANEGEHVATGTEIFAIAELDRVWLQMEAFESDLFWLSIGTEVRVEPEWGDEVIDGRIVFVDPVVDRTSRTTRVRVEVENERRPDGTWRLVPGQRVRATARVSLDAEGRPAAGEPRAALAIPRSALLRTGRRAVVYALFEEVRDASGEPSRERDLDLERLPARVGYEMVQVRVGPLARRADSDELVEYYPLLGVLPPAPRIDPRTGRDLTEDDLRELRPGHVLATKGALLLDSQAQLAGRPSLLQPEGRGVTGGDAHANH